MALAWDGLDGWDSLFGWDSTGAVDTNCSTPTSYTSAWIRQNGTDVYTVGQDANCFTHVNAAAANAGSTGVFAFWISGVGDLADAELLSLWEAEVGVGSHGHFHRLQDVIGRLTGIGVMRDESVRNRVNIVALDSNSGTQQVLDTHTFTSLAGSALPWYMRTSIMGDALFVKLWAATAVEPSWTDPSVASFALPSATNDTGLHGWLASGLAANESVTFSALTETAIAQPPPPPTDFHPQHSGYTVDEILDLAPGIGQIDIGFEFEALDRSLNFIRKLMVTQDSSISIRVNTASVIMRQLSGLKLINEDAQWIDVFQHRVRPVMIIAGHRFPLGVFVFGTATTELDSSHVELSGSLSDQAVILDQPLTTGWSISVGANLYVEAIDVIRASGVAIWDLPPDPGLATTTPMTWKANEHAYKILADIFSKLGWFPPFFNNAGSLTSKPIPAPYGVQIDHRYWTGNGLLADPQSSVGSGRNSRIFDGSLNVENSLVAAPNRYIVIASDATRQAIQGIYEVPENAPHSFAKRGFWITKVITDSNVSSVAVAEQRALSAAQVDLASYRKYEFSANPDPRHDVFDVLAIDGEIGVEFEWSLTCKPEGPHTHKMRKLWSLDGDISNQ